MGQAKKRYEQQLWNESQKKNDKYLCDSHFDDNAIREFIIKYSDEGTCSYCRCKTRVALYKDVIEFVKQGIFHFYGDADNEGMGYDGEEDGYWGANTYNTDEMLEDAGLEIDNDFLRNDILNSFEDKTWCEKDPYAERENEELSYNWKEFKYVVKHKSRYVFLGSKQFQTGINRLPIDEILNDIGRRVDVLNLFKWLDPDTLLYRCRQHNSEELLTNANQLTSPPDDKAIFSNRMSPAGISMFYCAFDKQTSHLETLDFSDKSKAKVTTGVFKNKEKLYLLNFTNLPKLPSIFDHIRRKHYYSILFLNEFVTDLSKRVDKDGRHHIEYVPTQIVTEYFRYTYTDLTSASIDGILYPSSRISDKNACVLFYDHKQSLEFLDFDDSMIVVEDV